MRSEADLRGILRRIDRRNYKAYKDIHGSYQLGDFELHVDRVQGDPFATPSRLRLRVPARRAGLPPELHAGRVRRVALADFLAREVRGVIRREGGARRGSGRSGQVGIDAGSQEVLERSAIALNEDFVEARLGVGLPAVGRTVLGRDAEELLCDELPRVASETLCWDRLSRARAERFVACVENQAALREQLAELGLVAFVAEGAILPRETGASDRRLLNGAIPFRADDSLCVELELPNPLDPDDPASNRLRGLGIPRGVTLIVGGGYHGKSTLLRALERGVYPHVPGDGREFVVTDAGAVKIRAEDGRRVEQCNISAFIGELPYGRTTECFSSDDASGSTSQAANIIEALEVGTDLLLLDEDTSATNFMVRDARMQALVAKEHEPITPFLDRVRSLWEQQGVSSVIVMGGCGDYFDVADTVIEMRSYAALDVTRQARAIATSLGTQRRAEGDTALAPITPRIPLARSVDSSRGRREVKIEVRSVDTLVFGNQTVDLRAVAQLVDPSQTRAVGHALWLIRERLLGDDTTLRAAMAGLDALLDAEGLDVLDPFRRGEGHPGEFARPRGLEVAAALCRLRSVRMRQAAGPDSALGSETGG